MKLLRSGSIWVHHKNHNIKVRIIKINGNWIYCIRTNNDVHEQIDVDNFTSIFIPEKEVA